MNDYEQKILKKVLNDGYTRVPHLVFESLAASNLNGTKKSLCMLLIRNTYGWGKITADLSVGDFTRGCQSERSWIKGELHELIDDRVFIKLNSRPREKGKYMFNHNITQWNEKVLDLNLFCQEHDYKIIQRKN